MEKVTVARVLTQTDGPVELDAALLEHVAGGLPKGGWGEPSATQTNSDNGLPKGGWEA